MSQKFMNDAALVMLLPIILVGFYMAYPGTFEAMVSLAVMVWAGYLVLMVGALVSWIIERREYDE